MPGAVAGDSVPSVAAGPEEDAAWVVVELPLAPAAALAFIRDVQRLFRLNPYLEIQSWETVSGSGRGELHRARWVNEMNGIAGDFELAVVPAKSPPGFRLEYGAGLKRCTEVSVEPAGGERSTLTLRDIYDTPRGPDREQRLREVDRSLVPWGAAIRRYVQGLQRWGRWPPYRWYMTGYWLRMKPRERRIARLLIWTTALEFLVFLLVLGVFLVEHARVSE